MNEDIDVRTERLDDFALLLGLMQQMELPALLDRHLPRHHLQQGVSWGWVTSIWLAHIISQGDHRKLTVRDWVRQAQGTIQALTGMTLRETDFTDDRLTRVLHHLSQAASWRALEAELGQHLLQVYAVEPMTIRADATTISGYHAGGETSLWQYGHSKDDPTLRQVKAMLTSLDPFGLPLAVEVVSGEQADDPLYWPIIERTIALVHQKHLLFVGDCKMGASETRSALDQAEQYYLMPLAMVGDRQNELARWVQEAPVPLTAIAQGETVMATGYERRHVCTTPTHTWEERLLVVQSVAYQASQEQRLDERLRQAETALWALTPTPGRGKRQIADEATLHERAEQVLQRFRVQGLLHYHAVAEVTQTQHFVGRGRGSQDRPRQIQETVRWQLVRVETDAEAVMQAKRQLGWRVYATNAPGERLSLEQAVHEYRQEYRIERNFGRLKDAPLSIAPLFVQREDQVQGMIHLLSLALRVLTLLEGTIRRRLQQEQQTLVGLHAENRKKASSSPTAERILQAFAHVTLTHVMIAGQGHWHITPLSPLQRQILLLLGLPPDLYEALPQRIRELSLSLRE